MERPASYRSALIFTLVFFLAFPAFGRAQGGKNAISYNAGYRQYKATDSSRHYKPGVPKGNPLYYRPEEIDLWYPAQGTPPGQPIPYRYYLSLFERRANSFQDSIKYNGLADELLQHFTIGNARSNSSVETKSFLGATAMPGRFPLIIYLSSYNGMSYENVPLFENLARRGYIVMSISSVGRYPGNMTTKYPDVLEQVRDAEFALHLIKNADTSKIGVIGYSYGGVAAALLAMETRSVKAILSLDGSEMHYYGRDKGEDKDFDELIRSSGWNPSLLQCSYAYMESDHKAEDGQSDSIYNLSVPTSEKKYYARLSGAAHEDFSCVSAPGANENKIYESVNQLAAAYFAQTIKDERTAFDAGLNALLTRNRISLSQAGATRSSEKIILSGTIVDAGTGNPLQYVSIGIPSRNCGTVSANDGKFLLRVDDTLIGSIVRISSLGYQPKTFTVKDLSKSLHEQPVVRLNQGVNELAQVNIKAGKLRTRIIGNTSQSKFFNVGFPLRDLGSEVSIRVALGSRNVLFRSLNFNISDTRMDSCTFRLNIYSSKNGMPGDNLLKQNIIATIGNKPGAYSIDLVPYRILLSGPVFISLEWIGGKTSASRGAVFFSAGLLSSSYHRKTTEADWVKFKGLGAAFSLKVEDE